MRGGGKPGRGYLAADLHPQEGQRLYLTGHSALSYVFKSREKAQAFAALANLPGVRVREGMPDSELDCPAMVIVPPAGN